MHLSASPPTASCHKEEWACPYSLMKYRRFSANCHLYVNTFTCSNIPGSSSMFADRDRYIGLLWLLCIALVMQSRCKPSSAGWLAQVGVGEQWDCCRAHGFGKARIDQHWAIFRVHNIFRYYSSNVNCGFKLNIHPGVMTYSSTISWAEFLYQQEVWVVVWITLQHFF